MKTYLHVAIVFTAGMLLSGLLAKHQTGLNQARIEQEVANAAALAETKLRQRIGVYEYGLRGARGVMLVTDAAPNRALFRRYSESRNVDKEFPGARGFGFIRRVAEDRIDEFVAKARADGAPDFDIRQLNPHQGERFVIQYIEPVERNRPALGLDIRSEANRRQAAETAMRTGAATLTGPITLVQKIGEPQRSLLFMLPVYQSGRPTALEAERIAACIGWTYAPLSLKEVLADFALTDQGLELTLRDLTQTPAGEVFFDASNSKDTMTDFTSSRSFEHYGRRWQLEVRAQGTFIRGLHLFAPSTLFALGTIASVLVSVLLGLLLTGRERKKAADEQKAQLAAIVEHSSDAIIGEALDGSVLSWNRGAERMFGYQAEDVIGKPLSSFILSSEQAHEGADMLSKVKAEGALAPFDAVRMDKHGHSIDVSISAGGIRSEEGRLIGVANLLRDIRERKDAERRLVEFNSTLEQQIQARTEELETARRTLSNFMDPMTSMICQR